MSKLEELKDWLNAFPPESEISSVTTSNWEDDALITVKTPDGYYHNKEILNVDHSVRSAGR